MELPQSTDEVHDGLQLPPLPPTLPLSLPSPSDLRQGLELCGCPWPDPKPVAK